MVINSLSEGDPNEERNRHVPVSYEEIFLQRFPYYLSIGMTEEQYWDKDCTLVKYYREAEEIRQERQNQEAWLQGMYVYDAISRLAPILHAYAKKGTKARPYPEEAYPINKKKVKEAEIKKERANSKKGKLYIESYMTQNNTFFKEKE